MVALGAAMSTSSVPSTTTAVKNAKPTTPKETYLRTSATTTPTTKAKRQRRRQ
jgi:hypothetical protein